MIVSDKTLRYVTVKIDADRDLTIAEAVNLANQHLGELTDGYDVYSYERKNYNTVVVIYQEK